MTTDANREGVTFDYIPQQAFSYNPSTPTAHNVKTAKIQLNSHLQKGKTPLLG